MAERWQQWMPHDIDAWQGSANVQALSDLAYRAVHNLLQDMWKQEDCALPDDDRELSKRSRVAARWMECRDEVLEYFTDRTADLKLTHRRLLKEWTRAKKVNSRKPVKTDEEISQDRSAAGAAGAKARWQKCQTDSKSMANYGTNTTPQVQNKGQKLSRDKREPDSRHVPFKTAVEAYGAHVRVKLGWDGSEAKQLDLLLKSSPDLTLAEFQACLNHRARSPGTPHGERPRLWLPNILKYQQGPLNTFGKTEQPSNAEAHVGMQREPKDEAKAAEEDARSRQAAIDHWRAVRTRDPEAYKHRADAWVKKILDEETT